MLGEKKTVVIYTDASVKDLDNDEFRSGLGLVVLFRKKKRFGIKFVSDIEYKRSKDNIGDLEYRALLQGVREADCTWGGQFNEVYIVSDSIPALKRLTKELKGSNPMPFSLKLYWIKGHQKYLLNELADLLSNNDRIEQAARLEKALIIPDEQPYAYFNGNGYLEGIERAYHIGEERDRAFNKLLKVFNGDLKKILE